MIYDSTLEEKFHNYCINENIDVIPQFNCLGWIVDFYIKDHNIIIELDGFDSHSFKTQAEKDYTKDKLLTNASYKVIRFRGDEIKYQLPRCINRLKAVINGLPFQKYNTNWENNTSKQIYMAKQYKNQLVRIIKLSNHSKKDIIIKFIQQLEDASLILMLQNKNVEQICNYLYWRYIHN